MKKFKFLAPIVLCVMVILFLLSFQEKDNTRAKAEQVKEGMTYIEVVELMGSEGKDIGSGAIIFEWEIDANSKIDVWFSAQEMKDDELIVKDAKIVDSE